MSPLAGQAPMTKKRLVVARPRRRAWFRREIGSVVVALVFATMIWVAVGTRITDSGSAGDVSVVIVPPPGMTYQCTTPRLPWDVAPTVTLHFSGPKERVRETVDAADRIKVTIRPSAGSIQPGQPQTFVIDDKLINLPEPLELVRAEPRELQIVFDIDVDRDAVVREPDGLAPPAGFRFRSKSFRPARARVRGPASILDGFLTQRGGEVVCRPFVPPSPRSTSSGEQSLAVDFDLPPGIDVTGDVQFFYQLAPDYVHRTFELPVHILMSSENAGKVRVTPERRTVKVEIIGSDEALERLAAELARGKPPVQAYVDLREKTFPETAPGEKRDDLAIVQLKLPSTRTELKDVKLPADTRFDYEALENWRFTYETVKKTP